MNRTTLSLIVPGLIDPVPFLKKLPIQDLPDLPVFSSFLSRGRYIKPDIYDHSNNNLYSCLLKQFSLQSQFSQPPVSSLSYFLGTKSLDIKSLDTKSLEKKKSAECELNEQLSLDELKNKWLMRVDPCFMAADRDQLILAQTGNLDISWQEAKQIEQEINQFYSQFNGDNFWTLKVISPERWYIISDKPIAIETIPPEKVLGQSLKSYLFTADTDENRYWLTLFNEFQMILHQSQFNKHRRENNKQPVNSVWFWGQDNTIDFLNKLSDKQNRQSNIILYSNNIVAQGMSLISGGDYFPVPDHYLSVTNEADQKIIYVLDDFFRAMQNKDVFSWVGLLKQFEENYLQAIYNDIDSGKISQLELISPTGTKLIVTKKLLRRWWKKNKKFYLFL